MTDNKHPWAAVLLLALSITIITSYYGFLLAFASNESALIFTSDVLSFIASLIAVIFVLYSIFRTADNEKTFWKWMLLAYIGYTAADGTWLFIELILGQEIIYPNICDFFYLFHPFFVFIGMLTLVNKSKKKESLVQLLLNISIGMTVLFIFSWTYIILPAVASSELTQLGIIISIVYPMADLAIVLSVCLISLTQEKFTFSTTRLVTGFILLALCDTIYMYQTNAGTYFVGSLLDPLWPAALLLTASAGLETRSNTYSFIKIRIKIRTLMKTIESKAKIWIPVSSMILLIVALAHDADFSIVIGGFFAANIVLIVRHHLELIESMKYKKELATINSALKKRKANEKNSFDKLKRIFADTEDIARKDHLTDTFNRRYIDEILILLNSRRDIEDVGFSVLLADIDNFKNVNDCYGHATGDEVLKVISSMIKEYIRLDEVLGRYGGDEFIVFLPGIKIQEAWRIAEKIRWNIAKRKITCDRENIHCSLSIGVAEWDVTDDSINTVIKKADAALYNAKVNGRNQCQVFSEEME